MPSPTSKFTITPRQSGDATILDCAGPMTRGAGASEFRDTVGELLERGNNKLVVNLAGVDTIDASGLGALVDAIVLARAFDGDLKLLNVKERAQTLLSRTNLSSQFKVFGDESSAVQSFKAYTAMGASQPSGVSR